MQHSFSLEISDLEPTESGVEQEITLEEAEKIVGGKNEVSTKITLKEAEKIVGGKKVVSTGTLCPYWPEAPYSNSPQ